MSSSETRETAFIAKITAGATHEIRNVLAIIKESAGLIEDMILFSDKRGSLDQDKLMRAVGHIKAQVSRGTELMANLSRLAHSTDPTHDRIDLSREVQQAAFLCQRFARQMNHIVQVKSDNQDPTVSVNPLRLQMAVFAAVECCLEQLPKSGTVTVHTSRQGDQACVEFVGEVGDEAVASPATEAASWSRLGELLNSLGASVEAASTACRFRVIFRAAVVE
jgi:C4-dicarboxylate-specific signal transduction histidine kinase